MSQNYTPEFKKKIVHLHEEEGCTYKSITAEYGVSKASISKWCSGFSKECQWAGRDTGKILPAGVYGQFLENIICMENPQPFSSLICLYYSSCEIQTIITGSAIHSWMMDPLLLEENHDIPGTKR